MRYFKYQFQTALKKETIKKRASLNFALSHLILKNFYPLIINHTVKLPAQAYQH